MTTMAPSATITGTYNMKSTRRTPRLRLRASLDSQSTTGPRHVDIDLTDMSTTEDPPEKEKEIRVRRAHRKSRLGCMRCKQARRKCDEAKPRCSRCVNRDADCKYPERASASPQAEQFLDMPVDFDEDEVWGQLHAFSQPSPPAFMTHTGAALSSAGSSAPSPFSMSPMITTPNLDFSSRTGEALDARESELLSHYLSHTARAFAYDTDDLYALQIGFPSLAFRSGLIMKSMLALAAVCKCHDVLRTCTTNCSKPKGVSADDVQEMRELMTLAEGYHTESLSQTQAEISGASYYEFALANAPLMVLYGLASQSIRVQVTEHYLAAGAHRKAPPEEFRPAHSQWISLIRAAHEAHTGMAMAAEHEASPQMADYQQAGKVMSSPLLGIGSTTDASLIAYDGRSSRNSKHLLLPIISATCHRALEAVRNKAMTMHLTASPQPDYVGPNMAISEQDQVRACATAVDILADIASKVCGYEPSTGSSPMQTTPVSQSGQSVALPSWLQDYLARVTNAAPSQPLHRTITSFVNRVPTSFLSLVQAVLAVVPVEAGSRGAAQLGRENLSPVQQLAMDIMAHWLVFVMLLDDIWWIGEVGGWELKRVTAVMKGHGGIDKQSGIWWPESMYKIRDEVEKHR
ncbi:hypothetical protein NLU13_3204 [Sarocladium strictum]|uniref:Zn(2)-C6 fungal-type domain-containing protein n=1 Tax=Sarocladium strictum TaxID=5046 RepID=A0AA39LA78_SARSR|nr:hypothetical protein NLU13_3204 [Sarocladium strictum]